MAKARDLKLQNNDIFIDPNTGDFVIHDSDPQHVEDIVFSYAGHWKEFPTVGVGIKKYLGSPGSVQIAKRAVLVHLEADGYRIDNVTLKNGQVFLTGQRR